MKLSLELKPLSVNGAWQGRRYKSKAYEQYEKDAYKLLRGSPQPLKCKMEVLYTFHIKNHTRTDIDNLVKPIQDILVKSGYITDDRYIYKTIIEKIPSKNDFIEIEIKPYMV